MNFSSRPPASPSTSMSFSRYWHTGRLHRAFILFMFCLSSRAGFFPPRHFFTSVAILIRIRISRAWDALRHDRSRKASRHRLSFPANMSLPYQISICSFSTVATQQAVIPGQQLHVTASRRVISRGTVSYDAIARPGCILVSSRRAISIASLRFARRHFFRPPQALSSTGDIFTKAVTSLFPHYQPSEPI